jgi:DNA-nicking Smr family endonuclease
MRKTDPQNKQLSESDTQLLAHALSKVIPLKGHERIAHAPAKKPLPIIRRERATQALSSPAVALSDGAPDSFADALEAYRTPSASGDMMRRLKRQAAQIRECLDLHGLTRDQARVAVFHFVRTAQQQGIRQVRIIHGQGYGSANGASILRQQTRHWLTQMPEVLGFVTPPPNHGGRGAVLVQLRSAQGLNQG